MQHNFLRPQVKMEEGQKHQFKASLKSNLQFHGKNRPSVVTTMR